MEDKIRKATWRWRMARLFASLRCAPRILSRILILLPMAAKAEFHDRTVGDKKLVYEYLEKVEGAVGSERFGALPYDYALSLAGTFGLIDRHNVNPEVFTSHVERVRDVQSAYYRQRPLSADEVKTWLLPQRLRYEIRTKGDWMPPLAEKFGVTVRDAVNAEAAARLVLEQLADEVELMSDAESYPISTRGDLDPLTVLKGGKGMEVDVAMCGVAALRSVGVAARIVWAPALREGTGGKMWLEYLGEEREWIPWAPSLGKTANHKEEIRKRFGGKIAFIMARPELPVEITDSYIETIGIAFEASQENVNMSILLLGENGLLEARGNDCLKPETMAHIGRGNVIIAASFDNRSFALLPVEFPASGDSFVVYAEDGRLRMKEKDLAKQSPQ